MKILLASNTCSDQEYLYIQSIKHSQKLNPSQKYFDMLVKGLSTLPNFSVTCLTARAIASSTSEVKQLPEKYEKLSDQLQYQYIRIINRPFLRNINNILQGYRWGRRLLKQLSDKEQVAFIGDPLSYDITFGALCAVGSKVKKCALVTDLPYYMHQIQKGEKKESLKTRIKTAFMEWLVDQFDCYCFLTESMNIINPKKKPYVIIEGMTYGDSEPIHSNHVENNVVVYAGGLFEQFGILNLAEAAKEINVPGFELHLYGEGTCIPQIKMIEKEYPHIKYMGTRNLKEIMEVEKNAKLLINPRPSSEEFTEYSFPSKTLEYMSTARPVLTTRLKGIPQEYFDYLFAIEQENVDGIRQAITTVLSMTNDELDCRGMHGYHYVMDQKNNKRQALKLKEVL